MKKILLLFNLIVLVLLSSNKTFSQSPTLGTTKNFVLFTSVGAVDNSGIPHKTRLKGNVGTNSGTTILGFGNIDGNMHYAGNAESIQAQTDLAILYGELNNAVPTFFQPAALGNNQVLFPGVHFIVSAASITGDIFFDAQGDSSATFIVKVNGTLITDPNAKVKLLNGAQSCNIFWRVEGMVGLSTGTFMRGNIVANGAIDISAGDTLDGRALTIAGAITTTEVFGYIPSGCNAPVLTGPTVPALFEASCYSIFTSSGEINNVGNSNVVGDIGSNDDVTSGFNPAFVAGTIHNNPDASTASAATSLNNVYSYLHNLNEDIELLAPHLFGHNLILTPHTYLLDTTTILTDTLFLNAEFNTSAVFVIQVNGSFSAMANSRILLINGAQANNVFWKITGEMTVGNNMLLNGNFITGNDITLSNQVALNGRILSVNGEINTDEVTVSRPFSSNIISSQPSDLALCPGLTATFSVVVPGTGQNFQWRIGSVNLVNSGNVSGVNTHTLNISSVSMNDASSLYNVIVSGACSPSDTSDFTTLTVDSATVIITQPIDQIVCDDDSVSFMVVANGTNLTYQWKKGNINVVNGANISGANSNILIIDPATIADSSSNYNVVVSGVCPPDQNSVMVSLMFGSPTTITTDPIDQTVCSGDSVTFVVSATGTNLTYQWLKGNMPLNDGGNISGVNTNLLTINPATLLDASSLYHVIVTGACEPSDTSEFAFLNINQAPLVTTEPINSSICLGDSAIFEIDALGTNLTYQWRRGNVPLVNLGTTSGVNSNRLKIYPATALDTASNYNVIVTGLCNPSDTSNNVSLIINQSPNIILQPIDQTVCSNDSVIFMVNALGTNLTYQWLKGNTPLNNLGNISGVNTNTLTINPATLLDASDFYHIIVTGVCAPADTSDFASLNINQAPLITTEPISQTVCSGDSAIFMIDALGTNLTYQWRKGNVPLINLGNISGADSSRLRIYPTSGLDAASDYNVIVTGTCSPSDTSANVSLIINQEPIIIFQPANQSVCSGDSVAFMVNALGTNLSYEWRKGNIPLNNGGSISGVNTNVLIIDPATSADASSVYNVIVTGTCSPADTSEFAILNINQAPLITSEPISQTICIGDSAIFEIDALGSNLTYQWRRGNVPLVNLGTTSGANSNRLRIYPTTGFDADTNYNVIVTGLCSPADTSNMVSLIINQESIIIFQPINQTVCSGDSVTFTITAIGTNLTYEWRKGNVSLNNIGNISGVNTNTLIIDPATLLDASSDYNVIITGTCSPTDTSDFASLNINQAPLITTEPISQTICTGDSAIFEIDALGSNLTYQWRRGNVPLVNLGNISGADSSRLRIYPATSLDSASNYNVIVTGLCNPADTSANVSLIISQEPVIIFQPISQTVCSDDSVTFIVGAFGTNLSYQWRKGNVPLNNGGNISGVNTNTLVIDSVNLSDASSVYNVIITGMCGPADTSEFASLNVNEAPSISLQPTTQTVCSGDTATFTVIASGSNLTYQWRRGLVNLANIGNVSGAFTNTLVINSATALDAGTNYNVVITGSCAPSITSANASLIINQEPVIIFQPINQTVCSGDSVAFIVNALGTNLTYEWRKGNIPLNNGGNISGVNTNTLVIDPANASDASSVYNVIITGTCSPADTSEFVSLNVNEAPSISLQPTTQTVCSGQSATFTVTASGSNLTYQWRRGLVILTNTANISGAQSNTLVINPATALDAGTNYNVVITGSCAPPITSANATLIINEAPVIVLQPTTQTVCSGNTSTFNVTATGTNLTYQWRRGLVNLTNTGNVSGAQSNTLVVNPATSADAGTNYNVVITGACGSSLTSSNASLIINEAPIITVQPTTQSVCSGQTATFTVTATGTNLTYQWRRGLVILTNTANVSGAQSNTLVINPATILDAGTNYNVVITGACAPSVTSSNVSLIINEAPVIVLQPTTQTVCSGNTATFNVTATGTNLTYQWRRGLVNLTNTGNVSGAQSNTLVVNPSTSADAGTNYNVVITGTCGSSITSSNVSLIINEAPVITTQPTTQTVCSGSSATFTATATGTNLTYQWRRGLVILTNVGNVSGAQSNTLVINPATVLDAGTNYNVVITGTCAPSVTSSNVSLIINEAPAITLQPTTQTVCSGSSATFTVTATGTNLTYQWRRGLINLTNTGNVSGSQSNTLVINPTTVADAGTNYNVVITGTCAPAVTSSNASLIINEAPAITVQPTTQTVCSGSAATFTVTATGTNLTYQWRKGLVNLTNTGNTSGVFTNTLVINPATVADVAANYNVVITGTCAPSITSNNVGLIITNAPSITLQPSSQTECSGSTATFIVTTSGSNLTYQWRRGLVNLTNGGNISGALSNVLIINPATVLDAGTNYNVVVTGSCAPSVTSSNVSLIINESPSITNEPVSVVSCEGNSATLSITSAGTSLSYQWRRGNVDLIDGGNISGATTDTLTINPVSQTDEANDYNVVVSGFCTPSVQSVNVSVTVNPIPVAVAGSNSPVCIGQPILLTSDFIVGASYNWIGPIGYTSTDQNPIILDAQITDAGTYSLTVTVDGCSSNASNTTVVVNDCNNVDLMVTKTVDNENQLFGQDVVFTIQVKNDGIYSASNVIVTDILESGFTYVSSTTSTGTYSSSTGIWTIGNLNPSDSATMTITANVNASGVYKNTATISGNEFDYDMSNNVSMIELVPAQFTMPQGFSPNGDGVNDVYVIYGIELYPSNKLEIYSRWGVKVYETSSYQNNWDGKSNLGLRLGEENLPVGTYFYLLDLGDGSKVYKGFIYLNK